MAKAGVGLVISGSMGEGHHLSSDERQSLIRTARRVLDSAQPSLAHVPIIAGTGAGSTRESIRLSREAAEAGADIAIVIISGYFAAALDKQALKAYWTEIADKSPIPVLLYNCMYANPLTPIDHISHTQHTYRPRRIRRHRRRL